MIDIKQFSALEKASKDSFAKQKQMVKKVMAGQKVLCPQCQQPLVLVTPENIAIKVSITKNNISPGICCKNGCTDLQLDFA